jgi:GTP-binding protein HflX
VLLSDTVGFIRDLPHHLIASFKATLEEARQADLLLHVADASNPAAFDQISAVYDVLQELGIEEKGTILVLNKVDQIDRGQLASLLGRYPNAIPISAHTGQGLTQLNEAVSQALTHNFLDIDVEMGVDNGRLQALLAAHGEILSKRYDDSRVTVHARIPQRALAHLYGPDTTVRFRNGDGHASNNGNGHAHSAVGGAASGNGATNGQSHR